MTIAHQNIKKQIPVNKIVIAHQNIDGLKKVERLTHFLHVILSEHGLNNDKFTKH